MHKKIGVLLTYVCLLLLVGCGAPKVIDNADNVEIAYTLRFTDATVYASGTNTFTIGTPQKTFEWIETLLSGKQKDEVITGILLPEQAYGLGYNPALQQKLAEIYFSVMNKVPVLGEAVFLDNVGTGIITAIDQEEGVKKYTLDFNPRETYEPLSYEIHILKVEKKS